MMREVVETIGGGTLPTGNAWWEAFAAEAPDLHTRCRACGRAGQNVAGETVRAISRREFRDRLTRGGFRYCLTEACPVVYYRNGTGASAYVLLDEVKPRVNVKEAAEDRPLCYCLRVDERAVLDAVRQGAETLADVQERTAANTGKACHVLNPSGLCCEPQVRAAISKGLARAGKSPRLRPEPEGDCCSPDAGSGA